MAQCVMLGNSECVYFCVKQSVWSVDFKSIACRGKKCVFKLCLVRLLWKYRNFYSVIIVVKSFRVRRGEYNSQMP